MIDAFTLSNGIKVVTYNMPSLKSVHLRLSIKGGSIVEKKTEYGVAHFMEHMIVQGIPSFPNAQSLSAYVEGLAGSYNAYTSQLTVSFGMTVPFSHAEDAVRIASEVFFEPLFPEDALEKERRAVLNEIKQDQDSRWYKFQEFFRNTRYVSGSPMKIKTGGSPETVQKLTRDDLLSYWEKYFLPKNSYLFIIGNLSTIDTKALLEQYFSKHTSQKTFHGFPRLSKDDLANRQVAIRHDNELQVNYIDFTFPSLSMTDEITLRIKQNIALIILGRLRTSRLFQLLRYEKGLVYSVSSSDSQWPGVGSGFITSEVSNEHLEEVTQLIVKELLSFREKGPLETELAFTKNYLSNSWLMSFDNPSSIAEWVSGEFLWKDKIRFPEDYIALLQDITVKDLVAVMQEHWDMSKLQLIIQGPVEDTKENKKKFEEMIKALK